jgi:hypothetical protein
MSKDEQIIPDFDAEDLPIKQDTGDLVTSQDLLQVFGVDVEQQVRMMKKAAELAPQINAYRGAIIKSFTYAQDWTKFGSGDKAKACCSNHAVMRVVDKGNFPIRFRDVHSEKEDIRDADNSIIGYRYLFYGYGDLGQRSVYAIGQYSTRDAFLGKSGGSYRDFREINESHIRQSAHTYFKGNVVKDLLGLKNIPWDEFTSLCDFAGQVAESASKVEYHQGRKGGTSDVDRTAQNTLYDKLTDLAQKGLVVKYTEDNFKITRRLGPPSDEQLEYTADKDNAIELLARASLKALTTWVPKVAKGGEKKVVHGTSKFETIKGDQLSYLSNKEIPKLIKEYEANE